MAGENLTIQNNKFGSDFELTYGQQNSSIPTTVPTESYNNPFRANFNFQKDNFLARLNQFDKHAGVYFDDPNVGLNQNFIQPATASKTFIA